MIKTSSLLLTGLLLSTTSLMAQQPIKVPLNTNPEWVKPYEPFRVAGNLYYVGTYDLASYLIHTTQGDILINTGVAGSWQNIRRNIEALGFKPNDIKILLNTQAHFDHTADLAEIKKITGARMMAEEADVRVLEDGGKSDFLFGGDTSSFAPIHVDKILHDHDTISLGETKLIALHHAGHTKGATSFLFDTKDEKRTWRVLIVNIPTILSQTRLSGMASYPDVGKDYARTFAALKELKFDLWVASHASQFRLHEKRKPGDAYHPEAFADRPGFEAEVNTNRREYEKRLKEK
jgi:metallo-beta-lactamase class B